MKSEKFYFARRVLEPSVEEKVLSLLGSFSLPDLIMITDLITGRHQDWRQNSLPVADGDLTQGGHTRLEGQTRLTGGQSHHHLRAEADGGGAGVRVLVPQQHDDQLPRACFCYDHHSR